MRNKIKSNDKIFIAGASGMVGSSIIRLFKKNGFQKNLLIPTRNIKPTRPFLSKRMV